MEPIFNIHKIEQDDNHMAFQIHGRSLSRLVIGQAVYLDNREILLGRIDRIITYGVELEEIEPMMGCMIEVSSNNRIHIPDGLTSLF